MKIKDLTPNKRNPRKISDFRLKAMADSLKKFGDLGGIIWNRRTKRLVGGHQRSKTLSPDSVIVIEKKYEKPTHSYTVAEGYVELEGERIRYREVDAPEEWEVEAMIAANAHGGEWDDGILAIIKADFKNLDTRISGLDLKPVVVDIKPLDYGGVFSDEPEEQSDEDYLKESVGPETFVAKEEIDLVNRSEVGVVDEEPFSDAVSVFEETEETVTPKDKRWVIIVDCKNEQDKSEIKEKLRPIIDQYGAKFF